MSGDGYGLPGAPQAVAPTTGATTATTPSTGATSPSTTAPSTASPATTTPQGLLQSDNSTSGFQLAAPTQGTNLMGTPSWMDDWAKSGSGDLNAYYQQNQGGYMDMTKPQATPAQLQFAPPPAPAAPAAAPAAAAPAAPQQQGNWWTPKAGPAPAVTKNSLWGSTPVGQAELDALPDAYVGSQSFLNQYGSSPGAQDYQRWRLGPQAYFDIQRQQDAMANRSLYGAQQSGR